MSNKKKIKLNGDGALLETGKKQEGRPEVVVVTSVSAGVGRAMLRPFAQDGAYIGLIVRGQEGLKETKEDVERLSGKVILCAGYVVDTETTERAAQMVEDAFGPIDVWVNKAASVFSPITQMLRKALIIKKR